MKRKIFSMIGVAAFAVAVAFNINASVSNNAEMDVTLANLEALADNESSTSFWCCGNTGTCAKGDKIIIHGKLSKTKCP